MAPVLKEQVRPPMGFRGFQVVDLCSWEGNSEAEEFIKLMQDLTELLGPPPQPAKDVEPETPSTAEPMEPEVKKGRLWVETEPEGATVHFLNLRSDFVQGMELKPGSYHVEVSASGYVPKGSGLSWRPGKTNTSG